VAQDRPDGRTVRDDNKTGDFTELSGKFPGFEEVSRLFSHITG
jgi:hypothetical protein